MKKKSGILILVEVILVTVICLFFAQSYEKNKTSLTFGQEDFECLAGGLESGYYLDAGMENFKDIRVGVSDIQLPKGSYELTLRYQSHGNVITDVAYNHGRNDFDVSGNVDLSDKEREKKVEFKINLKEQPVNLFVRLNSESAEGDYVLLEGTEIVSTFSFYRLRIFELVLVLLMLDICLFLYWNKDKVIIQPVTKKVAAGIVGIGLIASLPLMTNYMMYGQDLTFHLARLEGVKDGLLAGEFPVKIQSWWLNGHGYPVSVFYGDALLYFPAFLRIMGVSLEASYKIFVIVINIATAGVSYFCFSRIGGNKKAGLLAAFLYTLNLYRMTNLYVRVAVGEYSAMLFFPMILFGLWYIFTQDAKEVKKNKVWIFLAFGYLGVLNCHLISCEMAGIFTIFACLLQIKKVFQKERFLALLKAFLGIVVGGIWFMLPMLQYMQLDFVSGDLNRFVLYRQEERGLFWGQFFVTKYDVLSQSLQTSLGMKGEMPLTLGLSFLILLLAVCYVSICCYRSVKRRKEWFTCLILLFLAMWMCTKNFPYAALAESSEFLKLLINSLQYPWRFLAVVGLFASVSFVLLLSGKGLKEKEKGILAVVVCTVLLIDSVNFMSQVMNSHGVRHFYDEGNLSSFGVSGGEYMFTGYDMNHYVNDITDAGEGIEVVSWEKGNNRITLQVSNHSESEQSLEIPLIHYKGYQAKDAQTGGALHISDGKSHRIVLHLPAGYEGTVEVRFVEPWYWRAAELISLAGIIFAFALLLCDKRREAENGKKEDSIKRMALGE